MVFAMRFTHAVWFCTAISATALLPGAPATAAPAPSPAVRSAAAPTSADETEHTEAALRAIVEHWTDAEVSGDVAYLEQLLAPEYRSVSAKGASHTRAMLLDHARHNTGSAKARKQVEDFRREHPTEKSVVIHGDLAIVSYFDPELGVDSSIRGSDVFVYESHRWRAVYSLHNGA
jgi:hypothetical protein